MSQSEPQHTPEQTPFDDTVKSRLAKNPSQNVIRNLPRGTLLGLAITAGALGVILFSALVYRLTPQPKSPYLVTESSPRVTAPRVTTPDNQSPDTQSVESPESAIPVIANESPEQSEDRRLREERRVQDRNLAEQRQLEDKKSAIERQLEDKRAEEKRRQEDKVIEDARVLEDKRLIEAREIEDKKIADDRRLEAEREEAARKLAASQP